EIFSEEELSRFGPSHCGQSAAQPGSAANRRIVQEQLQRISISLFFLRPWLIEKFMQRGITPLDVVCPGQFFQSSKILFGQAVAGFLIVRITEEDSTSQRPGLAGGAQLVFLEWTEILRCRLPISRGV